MLFSTWSTLRRSFFVNRFFVISERFVFQFIIFFVNGKDVRGILWGNSFSRNVEKIAKIRTHKNLVPHGKTSNSRFLFLKFSGIRETGKETRRE